MFRLDTDTMNTGQNTKQIQKCNLQTRKAHEIFKGSIEQ